MASLLGAMNKDPPDQFSECCVFSLYWSKPEEKKIAASLSLGLISSHEEGILGKLFHTMKGADSNNKCFLQNFCW